MYNVELERVTNPRKLSIDVKKNGSEIYVNQQDFRFAFSSSLFQVIFF